MTTLTHWKKTVNPDYIGSYALESDKDMILTIKSAGVEMVTGNNGKKEEKLVIHFMEPGVKPMICNRTNAKVITKLHKTPYIEQWSGKKIQLYSSRITAFGEEVDALRIRDYVQAAPTVDVSSAIDLLNASTSLDELKASFLKLSKQEQSHPEVKTLTESLKSKLS